jgi:PIN domain nuclease of toxin-antitoxin system
VRLLVDTHAVLWWLRDDPALSRSAREAISDASNELLVSAASLWEMAIKRSLGKLEVPDDLPDLIADEGFAWLPILPQHAWHVRALPMHHRDPFDRLLVAQAQTERVPVITSDDRIRGYGVTTLW